MGVNYKAVTWNKFKKRYDRMMLLSILGFVILFIGGHMVLHPTVTPETLIIRTSSLVSILLLHFILIIGPLSRLNPLFLPLLYNRRHLGVTMFLFAAIHGGFSIIQFHSLGDTNAVLSIFTSNTKYLQVSQFPFQVLGFFALIIFFLMAATSHDFWLKNLSPRIWKALHMLVYVAYALVMLHVALGVLQYENKIVYWLVWGVSFLAVAGMHLAAGIQTKRWLTAQKYELESEGFTKVCGLGEIEDNRGKSILIDDQNIAIFKYENKISAVHNQCKHQMGSLAEGKVVDGCITCPWHGYQYQPTDGQSPPPFHEKLQTYATRVVNGEIWVNPTPNPEGTFVEPSKIQQS